MSPREQWIVTELKSKPDWEAFSIFFHILREVASTAPTTLRLYVQEFIIYSFT